MDGRWWLTYFEESPILHLAGFKHERRGELLDRPANATTMLGGAGARPLQRTHTGPSDLAITMCFQYHPEVCRRLNSERPGHKPGLSVYAMRVFSDIRIHKQVVDA